MKLKIKLLLVISLGLFFIVIGEIIIGESYFVKLFRYSKSKELESIDFIKNNKINYYKLIKYQKEKNAFVLILNNGKILNLDNFDYLKINTNQGEKLILLDAFLDNMYSKDEFKLNVKDNIIVDTIQILKNYYIPIKIKKDKKVFKDYKLNITKTKKYIFNGYISDVRSSNLNSSQGDDLLEVLVDFQVSGKKNENKQYKEKADDDEFQLLVKEIDGFKIIVFYSYEDINDVFPTLKTYFYIKGIFLILLTLVIGKLLEKIIIKPIENLSKITKNISTLNFDSNIYIKSKDEIGGLYKDIINMSNKLENIIDLYKEELKSNKNLNIKLEENIKCFMHEVKTPLSVIIGFSDLILLNGDDNKIKIINKEGKRLLNLSNELLLNNTLKNIKISLKQKFFNLISLIELANKICEVEKVKVNIFFNESECPLIYGDPEKIEQVILNIIKNGIEHTKDKINIYLRKEKKILYLIFENNGPKLLEKDLEFLWNKFYTTNGDGRGLGLYICSEILKAHGSNYGVKNIENGVQFYFSLNYK